MGLLKFLVILLIFLVPLGVVSRIAILPNAYFYLHDVVIFLAFLVFLYQVFLKKKQIRNTSILKPFLIFISIAFVSLLVNYQNLTIQTFLISLSYLLRYLFYFSLVFIIPMFDLKFLHTLKKAMLFSGFTFVILGFVQYFFYPNLRNLYYLGWDEHLARFFSTFLDPNFSGVFLSLYFVFLAGSIMNNKISFKEKYLYIFFSSITLIAIFFTYSRSAFLMLLASLAVLFYFKKKLKVFLGIFVLLVLMFLSFANPEVEEFNPLRTASSTARIQSFKDSVEVIRRNPFIGVGFNAYRYAQIRLGTRVEEGAIKSNADAGVDNSFLFVMATTGVIGFLAFIYLWKKIIFFCASSVKSNELSILALSSIIGIFVSSIFINTFFYSLILIWLFVLIGGSAIIESKKP